MTMPERSDDFWMLKALALARRGEGLTRPNPPVGAVVVKRGRMVGQGYHVHAGGPHAEVLALSAAGPKSRESTLYVTLEPCSTWGRTPPCTDLILQRGVSRVVFSVRDPNPRHRGRGAHLLKRAGVSVCEGVCAAAGESLIAPFAKWISCRRPFVTLKMAMSLDGRIADRCGRSKWISGPKARSVVQRMRRATDAVIVGAGTAVTDDPSLLPRPDRGRHPYRVVVDSSGRLSPEAKILTDGHASRTIIATTRRCSVSRRNQYAGAGALVWVLPSAEGRVSIPALMCRLGEFGLLRVLCEGGGELAASLVRAGVVDEFVFFVCPCLIGGLAAPAAIRGDGWDLDSAPRLQFVEIRRIGDDAMIRAIPAAKSRGGGGICSQV